MISQWTSEPKPRQDSFPTGRGGGASGEKPRATYNPTTAPRTDTATAPTTARITSRNESATLSLPDLPGTPSRIGLSGESASSGTGGGRLGGRGPNSGLGIDGPGYVSPFGAKQLHANTLEGLLYDLKFSPSGKALGDDSAARVAQMKQAFDKLDGGWGNARNLLDQRYKRAKAKLYTTNIFIPPRQAGEATKAFDCEQEIRAPGWLAYYEGWFTVPDSGQYRFVGLGDDMMAVAVSGRTVMTSFWPGSGLGKVVKFGGSWLPKGADGEDGRNLRFPANAGGRYSGEWIDLRKGQACFIQVAFAESFGGLFGAQLLIERKGQRYQNNGREDLLPIFMLEPLSTEEIQLKQAQNLDYVTEGPSFGCEANRVAVPHKRQ